MQISTTGSPAPDLPTDTVARIRQGDVAAFEALFRAMHLPLRSFAARYLGDTGRAEELVQELFLEIWIGRATWSIHGSVRAYLFTAARNRALNVRRRDAVEQDWAADEAHDAVRTLHPRPVRPDAHFEHAELRARLDRALGALPERCGMVMHLRWRDGMSYAEIAQVLGISVKGVETHLARGLRALQEKLAAF